MRISDWSSDVCSSDLEQVQAGLRLHPLPHCCLVQAAIGLTPRGPHRRALARVERAPLDAGVIGCLRHHPTEGVDFLDQMTLADATDRRVATHLRSEEHTSELQSLMRISYAVLCLKKKKKQHRN